MKMTLLAALTFTAWVETAFSADTPPPEKAIGINPAYRNLSVKPGDDFEEYANGGWRKTAEIPTDRSSTGATFEVFQRAEQEPEHVIAVRPCRWDREYIPFHHAWARAWFPAA